MTDDQYYLSSLKTFAQSFISLLWLYQGIDIVIGFIISFLQLPSWYARLFQATHVFSSASMQLNFVLLITYRHRLTVARYFILLVSVFILARMCLCLYMRLGLFMSRDIFFITIFIFIRINHIISLKQIHLFCGHFCEKFSLRLLLSFCLIFCQFQSDVPYKSFPYKKACSSLTDISNSN